MFSKDFFYMVIETHDCAVNGWLCTTQSWLLTTLKMEPFENIMGKGENAGRQHFLLFPQYFLPIPKRILVFKLHLFCRLQMFSIWTSRKVLRTVGVYRSRFTGSEKIKVGIDFIEIIVFTFTAFCVAELVRKVSFWMDLKITVHMVQRFYILSEGWKVKGSVKGHAKAWTPNLMKTIQGYPDRHYLLIINLKVVWWTNLFGNSSKQFYSVH